jgi:hypothetical protein
MLNEGADNGLLLAVVSVGLAHEGSNHLGTLPKIASCAFCGAGPCSNKYVSVALTFEQAAHRYGGLKGGSTPSHIIVSDIL